MNKPWTDKSKGMNSLADRIAGLSPAKRALMELRLKKKEPVVSGEQHIPQREKRSSAPLSFAQQRLWFLNQMGTGSAYNIPPLAIRLKGLPNIKALEESLNEIIRRHDALRTTFRSAGGRPVQVIEENISSKMPLIDLSGQPKAEREAEAERLTREEAMRRFDLAKGPLFSAALIRLSEEEHILLLTMHHIVSDGWSKGVITAELAALYKAYCNGEASPLPELPIQYADFAHWQREWLQGEVLENQLSYWRKQLAGVPVLQLFTDRPRPAVQTFAGASQNIALSPTLTGALNDLSQRQGVTLFMTLLAAFQTLLYRHTGQEDIVVGSPIANRNRSEIEGLIGFFVNSLAMRTDLSGNPSFLELLGRVGEVAFGAFEHQDLPFEKLVEELHPERDMSRTPLFQIMFVLQNTPAGKLQLPGLTLSSFAMERITVRFDIEIHLWEKPEGLSGRVVYNTDLFDDATIARWMEHYETLLESIVADPDQRISDLQILTDTERQQLLVEWNATETDYPRDRCVHQLFEQQVEQSPDAVAVVFKDQELTYRELNCRANQLAHHLQSLGVEPEVLVGICMQRSLEMIVGLLGVLKAGGAYVPLDSNYPAERLSFMLQDTGVPVLLIQKRLLNALPECRAKVICLDTDWAVIGKESEENLDSGARASNLAYVMYTSGSTGKPKGVCCNHAGMVNLLSDFAHRQPLHTGEGCSLWTSISFDVSVYEIFSALPAGGTLYIVPESVRSSAMTFVRWLSEHKIKSAYLPPFALSDLCDWLSGKQGKLCLSRLLVGVEPIQEQILAEIIRQVPGLQIINGYGPTEATICATLYSVKNLSVQNGNTPIGRPVQNTNIYLLNTDLKLVPIGNPGELYIGGVGLARGYLNRAELTAEKFIPNPFSDKKGDRLYKSGDLVRYLQDGSIEFLGRIDHQVKIRGFRIELGEIESVLSRHPKVSDTVVIAREDVPGDKRLVAYVVASHEPTPTFSELRSFLKEKLPDYMIPSAFGYLDSLPLTPNGKVDRRALPAPDVVRPDLQEAFVAPRSQSEELVAGIWSSVLGLERIGVYDSFFELGGHSLLAVQIVSRIREVFEVELPLRALFEAPTVAGLTERIEAARRSDEGLQTSPLQAVSRDQDLPLSFAQERLWFLHHLEPDSVAYSMPRSIRLKGMLNKDALEKTYVELACRHETLRTTFDSTDGNPVLRISAEPNIVLDTVDLRHLPGMEREAEVKRLSAEDARKPFDLARGPLFRIRLFQLEDEAHVLHSNMHHIISDGWSFGVMAREIAALYTAFIKGKPVDLPELPVQYADYAVWQRQWLQGEALGAQLNYWKDKLGGELPVLELPTDRPRPAVQTHRGAIESLALPKELTDALQVMSRREGVTLFMTLLAAFKTLLYRHTGQEDTIVGTPIAGRNRTELEGLIGFFMNTIVLRTDLSGQPSFRELLGRVRETALGAYAHQDMPFAKLVEELAPKRDLSRTPLFQVFFNHIVAMGDKAAALPGLKAAAVGGLDRESKFDMTLTVLEGESGLAGRFEYNADLFDAERIERMVGHFQTLLEGIVTDPEQRISDLPLLPVAERDQLLLEWNDTRVEYRRDEGIHQLFESQAERSPEAVAVVFEDDQLTYGELEHRANQLAHHLQALGVGPDTLVGIYMERSVEMMVGLLGVLKAGGAYVPLDPAFPQERLAFMLADSQAPVLLTQQRLLAVLPESEARVLCLDTDWHAIGREFDDRPVSAVKPTDLAYVIYTSGSTGKPKGVQIPHRAGVNFLNSMSRQPGLTQQDVLLAVTTLSFDIALLELFLPIIVGARVVIVSSEVAADGYQLQERMSTCGATVMQATPATWRLLLETDWPGSQQLKVLCGGEGLPRELANQLLERVGSLWNMYGPTETTVWSTVHAVESEEGPILIGRPIDNTEIYILDSRLQPVPIGIPGELYIGGDGLAHGYFNRSNLTAEKFIAHPFSEEPQARIYNTGDMVRYLPDGTIECLGRMDHQVKIRGFRIELGEIEAVLGQHPGIEESVVIVREDVPGDKRLVGYLIVNQEPVPTVGELRSFLKQKLPDYMVPSAFVELEAMPLTPNRKVDRKALPKPQTDGASAEGYVAPRTEAEQKIAAVWQEVLNCERVGVHDDFFELGGHSLLATQVMSRINKLFNIQLPLRRFFEATTIEALAEVIEISLWNSQDLQKSGITGIEEREVIEL